MADNFTLIFNAFFPAIRNFFGLSWWFWLFIILIPLFKSTWVFWRQTLFKNSLSFVLLEINMPREVRKSPRAMEQVLAALHSLRNSPANIEDYYWDGEVSRWFSLEIVSFDGEVHFYIRAYAKQKRLVEAAFFSFYPDVEIIEVEDYVNKLPLNLDETYKSGYKFWGTEMILSKEEAYPIKSYHDFESSEEEKQYDPMSAFLEVLSGAKKGETVGIQILIAPAPPKWKDKWEGLVEKLKESAKAKTPSDVMEADKVLKMRLRTPGETDILEAVENNLSKPAFQTIIRILYLSHRDVYYESYARSGVVGIFNQYATLNLNSFVQNFEVVTMTKIWYWPYIFPKLRCEYKKQRMLYNYKQRRVPEETFIGKVVNSYLFNWDFASKWTTMNTESLATIFHPPTYMVLTAPHLKRVESHKVGPPAGLAIFGEEKEIEKFQ